MIHVYLDDMRPCPKGFVPAKNAEECILLLKHGDVDILSLDHDLGWDEASGYDLTKYMVRHRLYPKQIYIHTANPIGRANMYQLLYRYKPEHVKLVNGPLPDEVLRAAAASHNEVD